MDFLFIITLVALAVLPWALKIAYDSTRQVVFTGELIPSNEQLSDIGLQSGARYCWFDVPGIGMLLAEIDPVKFELLNICQPAVQVTVTRHLLGKPRVESVAWPGEAPESADRTNGGLFLSVFYLLAGLAMLVIGHEWAGTVREIWANYWSAGALALSGYVLMIYDQRKFEITKDTRARILFLPLGKGRLSLIILLVLCLAGTLALFTWLNIFTLILGIHTAFATGSLSAILSRAGTPAESKAA